MITAVMMIVLWELAFWELGGATATADSPHHAWDILTSSSSFTCNQGDIVGSVENVELLSIGNSKNVFRGFLRRGEAVVPVVLKEYRIASQAQAEAPSQTTLQDLWARAPRLAAAFRAHTTPSTASLHKTDAAEFLHHDAHGNLATAWSNAQLDFEIDALYANYDTDSSGSLDNLEVARWLFDRLLPTNGTDAGLRFRRSCELQLLQRFARLSSDGASIGRGVFPAFYGRCTENTFIEEQVQTVFTLTDLQRTKIAAQDLVGLVQKAARLESESRLTFLSDLNEHNFGFRVRKDGVPVPVILDASYCAEDGGETFRLPQFCDAVRRMVPGTEPSHLQQEAEECLIWNLETIFPSKVPID